MELIKNSPTFMGLMAAIEATSNGVVLVDLLEAGEPITYANPAFEEMTGYRCAEVIGQNCRFLQGPETGKAETVKLRKAISEGRHYTSRLLNYRKNGSTFWNELTISPVFDDGAVVAFVGIQNDVSSEVMLQRELNEKIETLQSTKLSLDRANAELRKIADFDPLTGLPTRRLLQDRLTLSLARAKRMETMIAVAFIDLDGFKQVNDNYGHEIGDLALRQVAGRMREQVRESDTLARQGGDEFILLLDTFVSRSVCTDVCDRIRSVFSTPFELGGVDVHLGVSIGTAFYPDDGNDAQSLLGFADTAMYEDKSMKRHQIAPGTLQISAKTA